MGNIPVISSLLSVVRNKLTSYQVIRNLITGLWPPAVLIFTVILISLTNYKSGTYLMGGDNLMPELNFPVNIQRSFFAVWQEYQGLGLLGGMGHASDLLRQLILLILSIVLPSNVLRYTWTMLMLVVGSIGTYYLIRYLMDRIIVGNKNICFLLAFTGALFYLLNFSTVQTFYIPFEVFTAHFGFLPWLLLSGVMYFEKQTKKTLLFFVLVLILATPAAYVPTLFVVYLMALTILLVTLGIQNYLSLQHSNPPRPAGHPSPEGIWRFIPSMGGVRGNGGWVTTVKIKIILKMYLIIFLINAFWLLPFLYFTITNSDVVLNAKINQMATDSIIYRNIEFGDLLNVALLRGFWLNNVTPIPNGTSIYVFDAWRQFLGNTFVTLSSVFLFVMTFVGGIFSLRTKKPLGIAFVVLCIFSIIVLTTNTPPFSWIDFILREYVPLFKEVFRFPFTKFSILASLCYAVLLPFGIYQIISYISPLLLGEGRVRFSRAQTQPTHKPHPASGHLLLKGEGIVVLITILLIVISVFPIFQGHFFFYKEEATMPKDYAALFDFFKQQDPNTRIADFPQNVYWGWTYTTWNYDGSGFLWYGIKQPILDRAFDVWSRNDENYYWELSTALTTQDTANVDKILQKYQISWLVVDKNDFYAYAPKEDVITPLEKVLHSIPKIHKIKSFGNIDVYAYDLDQQPQAYISAKQYLPNMSSYAWSNIDQIYRAYGDYETDPTTSMTVYPFRSLFTNKSQSDIPFSLKENADSLTFSTTLDPSMSNKTLTLPQIYEGIPTDIVSHIGADGLLDINLVLHTPNIRIDNKTIYPDSLTQTLFRIPKDVSFPFTLVVNNTDTYSVPYANKTLGTSILSSQQPTGIELKEDALHFDDRVTFAPNQIAIPLLYRQSTKIALHTIGKNSQIEITIPKATNSVALSPADYTKNVYNCDNFRKGKALGTNDNGMLQLYAQDATSCLALFAPQLRYDTGYALLVPNTFKKGQALHVWLDNPVEKSAPLDTMMSTSGQPVTATFIIPPITVPGTGYGIHLDEDAYGSAQTINDIGTIHAYPIPYQFLTHITIGDGTPIISSLSLNLPMQVTHPNESLYGISLAKNNTQPATTLIVSQSYDSGWKIYQVGGINWFSYAFPFLAGHIVSSHVMVNNWENGWNLDGITGKHFIIVYLPQYLEYLGFLLGFITILYSLLGVVRGNGRWIKPRHIDKSNSPTKPDIPEEPNATTSTPTHTMESLQKELRDLAQESASTSDQSEPNKPQQQSTLEQDSQSRDTMHRAPTTPENQDTNKPVEPIENQDSLPIEKSAPVHEEIILKKPEAASKPETPNTSTPSHSQIPSIPSSQQLSKEAQIMHHRHQQRQQNHKQTKPSHPSHHKPQPNQQTKPQQSRTEQPLPKTPQVQKPTHHEEKKPEQKEETVFDVTKD